MTQEIGNSPAHGTAIAVRGRGFLFLGASGAGKSGLGLQMMALGADLVADDQVVLSRVGAKVLMRAPEPLSGLIEARNLGVIRVPCVADVELAYVVDLEQDAAARMPQLQTVDVMGVAIDLIAGRNVPHLASTLFVLASNGRIE